MRDQHLDLEKLCGAVRMKRRAQKLTVHEVGTRIGSSGPTIARLERGDHEPTSATLVAVLGWLDRPLDDFLELRA
jgi:transcriptional regulator with XRE-family HTH domain